MNYLELNVDELTYILGEIFLGDNFE